MPTKDIKYLKKILKLYGFQPLGPARYSTSQGISVVEENFRFDPASPNKIAFSLAYEEDNATSFAEKLAACASRNRNYIVYYKIVDEERQEMTRQLSEASEAVTAACEGRPFLVPNSK